MTAYAVLSYFGSIFGITYGPIQCRFSEALCVRLLPAGDGMGLGVGCLIANLLSPYGKCWISWSAPPPHCWPPC